MSLDRSARTAMEIPPADGLLAALARAAAETAPSALLVAVLDQVTAIRDSLGNERSEQFLAMAADRLRSACGPGAEIFQLDRDAFAVIEHGASEVTAGEKGERLVDLLSRTFLVRGQLLDSAVSVGVVPLGMGSNPEEAVRHARLAVRAARHQGRNRARMFKPAMDERMQARRSLEIDLRRSLALRELTLFYQPQFDLRSQRTTGFEALLRWRHPVRGMVSPAEFVPLSEEIGMIVPIGEWVIRTACREAAEWPAGLSVAVNVSAMQFSQPGLAEVIVSALVDSGLAPQRLEVEITESVLIGDERTVVTALRELRALGVRVALDDFGTGYSSLSYLRAFPFDKIKIDQSFVRGEGSDATGSAIVHAVAMLGQRLGISTLAEGVETEEQLQRVRADGCSAVQSYLISRPLPADRVSEFLAAQPLPATSQTRTAHEQPAAV